jgi:hypothetical protein
VSLANGVAMTVLIWAIFYDLFAYLPWRMGVLILVTAIAALVVVFRPPQGGGRAIGR